MLYEVITVGAILSAEYNEKPVFVYENGDKEAELKTQTFSLEAFLGTVLEQKNLTGIGVKQGFVNTNFEIGSDNRITSYNVCYTKLLR